MMMIANGYPAGYRYTHRLRPGPRNGSVQPPGPRGRSLTASPAPAPGHWQAGQSQQPVSSGWSSPWQASAVMPVGLPADTSLSHGTEAAGSRLPHGTQASSRRGVQRANNDSDHFHRVAGCHRTGKPYIDRNVTVVAARSRRRRPGGALKPEPHRDWQAPNQAGQGQVKCGGFLSAYYY
jgi:hypothetical protein